MEILNYNDNQLEIGGNWACWLGCGSFCLLFDAIGAFLGSVSSAL
ncbi:hypothetical protein Calkr_0221 [Caldicellulosiruptor acetigenus I77R1B]|uniref:Uncharacterized protein n=1 Tax=Caldicellulosiruptor acetigenus (strain ATCC 700853 / DSM 12137 / I77R1B) TaxID=632335 RepID=E4S711_CALA7|nr:MULTISPECIES: hypothetical protein [Caldicellulosiruptor]ADQ39786.1 hypothetical protein Calkr_0221 [Caldicellulosiruptor acetigenus I77R1B]